MLVVFVPLTIVPLVVMLPPAVAPDAVVSVTLLILVLRLLASSVSDTIEFVKPTIDVLTKFARLICLPFSS